MPPPSWAKRATKLAPKPKPTIRNGATAGWSQPAVEDEDAVDAEQREGDDEEAGDGAAAHGDLDRLDQAPPRGRGRPHVRLDADVHADDARRHRAGRADQEGDPGPDPEVDPEVLRLGDVLGLDRRDDRAEDRPRATRARMAIVRYWRRMNATAPSKIVAATSSISLVPGVAAQHVAGQVEGEEDRQEPGDRDDELELFGAHGLVLRPPCHAQPSAVARPSRRGRGILRAPADRRPIFGAGRRGGSGRGRVYQLAEPRVKPRIPADLCTAAHAGTAAGDPGAAATPCPYTAGLVTRRPLGCLFEIVETLVLTLIIFFVIQTFVAQPYRVEQQSMERTLEPDQYVLVDKLTPRFDQYSRGDIVVFEPPEAWVQGGPRHAVHQAGDRPAGRDDRGQGRPRLRERHAGSTSPTSTTSSRRPRARTRRRG